MFKLGVAISFLPSALSKSCFYPLFCILNQDSVFSECLISVNLQLLSPCLRRWLFYYSLCKSTLTSFIGDKIFLRCYTYHLHAYGLKMHIFSSDSFALSFRSVSNGFLETYTGMFHNEWNFIVSKSAIIYLSRTVLPLKMKPQGNKILKPKFWTSSVLSLLDQGTCTQSPVHLLLCSPVEMLFFQT